MNGPLAGNPSIAEPSSRPAMPRGRNRRRWILLAFGVFLAAGGYVVVEAWAEWHERAAARALEAEQADDAKRHIEWALMFHTSRAATHLLAGKIERERRSYTDTEAHLLRAKNLGGMTPELQLQLMLLRCEQGEVDVLAPDMLAAVRQNHPAAADMLQAMALVYMRQARYGEALEVLDQWVGRAPESARARDWRGWVSNQLDRRGQAIDDCIKALELHPDRFPVRLRLAQILIESSRHAEAVPHLEALRRTQPENPDVAVGLAACRIVQLRLDEARDLLDKVLDQYPGQFEALVLRGNLEREEGRFAEAEKWLRKALAEKPLDPGARYALHLSLQAQSGRQEEADAERARWEHDRDDAIRLAELLRTHLVARPADAELAAEAGELLLRRGEAQRGLYWLEKAVRLAPGNRRALNALAQYRTQASLR